jgi:hypothetical protein
LFEYPVKGGVEGSQLNCTRSAGGPFFPESVYCADVLGDSISILLAIVDS